MTATTVTRPGTSSRSTWRWVTFFLVAALIAGLCYYARTTEMVDDSFRMMATLVAIFLSLVMLGGWFVFFGGSRWWARLGLVLLACATVFGSLFIAFSQFIEVRGVSGDWVPEIALKSTPKKDYSLPTDPPVETPTVAPAPAGEVPDFARFLGSNGSNRLDGVGLEPDWEKHPPKQLWRKPVGAGWSAFAVVKERAVTQEQRGKFELVTCYNLRDGALLWSHKDEARFSEFQGGDGPRATPTIVGDKVFTMGATGILNGLTLDTGKSVWKESVNVLDDNGQKGLFPMWAKSDSPLVYHVKTGGDVRQLVVVTLGEDMKEPKALATLAAYDALTGERFWATGADKRAGYTTPIETRLCDTTQIVSVNGTSVTGHDPATGGVLWTFPWDNAWAKCSQPVPVGGDRLLLSMGYHVGAVLIQLERDGDKLKVKEPVVWQKPRSLRTTFSNVVVYQGYVYGLDDGVLQCVNLETGEQKWRAGRYRYGQVFGVDDMLIVQAEDGKVFLVAADPEKHRELGELDALHSKTWNNPVLVGRYLLLRDAEEAVCYELPLKGGK